METTTTIKTPTFAADQTDAVLGFFNTPEHHARVNKARRKQTFHYWKTRLTIDALLIALGFVLGTILI